MTPTLSGSRARRSFAAMFALALVVGACGGDDDDSDAPAATEPGAAGTTAGEPGPVDSVPGTAGAGVEAGSDDREAWVTVGMDELGSNNPEFDRCVVETIVDGWGIDSLVASGASPEEFWNAPDLDPYGVSFADRDGVKSSLIGCGDLVSYFTAANDATEVQAACINEHFTGDDVAEVLVSIMSGQEPGADLIAKQTAVQACAADAPGTTEAG